MFSICENMVWQNPPIIYTHPVFLKPTSKLQYASHIWRSITCTDANKHVGNRRTFADLSVCTINALLTSIMAVLMRSST